MAKNKNIQVKPDSTELTEFERNFCDLWFRIRNGRLAYKQLKPNVKDSTADTESSKILSLTKVKNYLEKKEVELQLKEQIELSWIIKELKDIVYDVNTNDFTTFDAEGRPLNKRDHRAKIEAIKTLAKIAGLEAPNKLDVTSNGQTIIPEIKINIIKPEDGN
jgi:hypothetical protein